MPLVKLYSPQNGVRFPNHRFVTEILVTLARASAVDTVSLNGARVLNHRFST